MRIDHARIRGVIDRARARGARVLVETEGIEVLEAVGIPVPVHLFVRDSAGAATVDLSQLTGERVVVKVISGLILHKSDVGGVAVVLRDHHAVTAAIQDMEARLGAQEIAGFTVNQFVTYDRSLGNELLVGLRWTEDFGPVVTLGAGGIYTEFLAASFKPGREIAILSPAMSSGPAPDARRGFSPAVTPDAVGRGLTAVTADTVGQGLTAVPADVVGRGFSPAVTPDAVGRGFSPAVTPDAVGRGFSPAVPAGLPWPERSRRQAREASAAARAAIAAVLEEVAVTRLVTGRLRGQPPRIDIERLVDVVCGFMALAQAFTPEDIAECEINPLVITPAGLIALDILITLGTGPAPGRPARPIAKLKNLLEPASVAIIGVSEKLNPGHIILNNLIREGFARDRICVVKPGSAQIEGCSCVPDIASIPGKVDLFILAIAAAQTPEAIAEVIEQQKAESLIVIPGGLEEKQGTGALVARMRAALAASRASAWQGPVINGGNCLGIRSRPGRCDTMFIPEFKLPVPKGETSPVAIVSQSGAFAVARMSKLSVLNPKYSISVGNQMDLTIGDYLTYLKDDREIEVFAVYVEGFTRLDGLAFLEAAREITTGGRTVILYRAGRTAAGAQASASHTASIAGDYAVTRELARQAGIVVADSLQDFDDLTRLFTLLRKKRVDGRRLGAISNAGFECVAMADSLGRFTLAPLDARTNDRLQAIFRDSKIDSVVDVHNPLDLTPMTGDAAFEQIVATVMASPAVDVGIVGLVPLTWAMNTLEPGPGHTDDVYRDDSTAGRMVRLHRESAKAWVAVVDAGFLYDPLARLLEQGGVPTFRTADTAMRLLDIYCGARLRDHEP